MTDRPDEGADAEPRANDNQPTAERALPPARVRVRRTEPAPTPGPAAETPTKPETSLPPAQSRAGDYEVGYKKPPVHSRFKKGQIANPKGRPKGAKSLSTLVDEALSAQIDVTIGRRKIRTSKRDAMVKQYVDRALRGDMKAFAMLVKLDPKARLEEQTAGAPDAAAKAEDIAGLLAYLNRDKAEDER